ncbi:15143_t:CDS:1, partial [Entrophospora sp. SA101]
AVALKVHIQKVPENVQQHKQATHYLQLFLRRGFIRRIVYGIGDK